MTYDVLIGGSPQELIDLLSNLGQGWKCQGGIAVAVFPRDSVFITDNPSHMLFYQAVVKRDVHLWVTGIGVIDGRESRPQALCGYPDIEDSTMLLDRVTCPDCLKEQKRIERVREGVTR